jgi:hypothetical protein
VEVEELLGMLNDPFGGVYNTSNMLTNADFKLSLLVPLMAAKCL